ncbi:MAG: dihydroorotate dehydrogenase electron transfer subunit [Thermoanaerobaculum sp.]|nr:dihydroorotate dehydrogenase electron transfer subunit [Thermoanaerobaculum sp.]
MRVHGSAFGKPLAFGDNAARMERRSDQPVILASRQELSRSCFALELLCPGPLTATPGQFIMLGPTAGADPLLRRPFSVAGVGESPRGFLVQLLVKEVGKFTSLLRRLPIGSELSLLGPLGQGFRLLEAPPRPVLVAGGIGLPPVLYAARELSQRGIPFDLFYGAASSHELLLPQEVKRATNGLAMFCTDDGSFGEQGLVTEVLRRLWQESYSRILACGPTPMLYAVAQLARERQVEAELSLEEPMACGVGVCLGCVVRLHDGSYVPSCQAGPVFLASQLAERW